MTDHSTDGKDRMDRCPDTQVRTAEGRAGRGDTGQMRLMNTADGLFPQWAWDTEDGVLVARCEGCVPSERAEGERAYRLLKQALSDPTARVEFVNPDSTPFADETPESQDEVDRGTCAGCGRNNVTIHQCRDERYGDEISVCEVCVENEPEFVPTGGDR